MTPKEKATKLTDAFYQYLPLEKYVTTSDGDLSWEYGGWENAKQCALIAVDEVVAQIEPSVSMDVISARIEYWQEVKQEIEKL